MNIQVRPFTSSGYSAQQPSNPKKASNLDCRGLAEEVPLLAGDAAIPSVGAVCQLCNRGCRSGGS